MADTLKHVVLLVGGIGSGKSTVGRLLGERGAFVIDADRVGHSVLEPGGAAFARVALRWPEVVTSGRIDRRELGRIVFTDSSQLAELEAITHPAIARELHSMIEDAPSGVVVIEMPILAELLVPDTTVVVAVPSETRFERLRARGMADHEITARMAAQPNDAEWDGAGDDTVGNEGGLVELEAAVSALWERLGGGPSRDGSVTPAP